MGTNKFLAVGAIGLFASSAVGNFTGFSAEYITLPNGHLIQNVYANFSSPTDRLLNIYNTNITTNHPTGFYQSSENPHWKPGADQHRQTSDDSWVTIGSNPDGTGRANGHTEGDPNFYNFTDANGSTNFSYVHNLGNGAGWYYVPPSMGYGDAWDQNRVLAAHFVWDAIPGGGVPTTTWQVTVLLQINGNTQSATPPEQDFTAPAPAGLALLALAGVAGGRGRRRAR